jgi:hypothetical protein
MSQDAKDLRGGEAGGAGGVLAQAAAAEGALRAARRAAIADYRMPLDLRIDDHARAAIDTLLRTIVGTIGGDIQGLAARAIEASGGNGTRAAIEAIDAQRVTERAAPMLIDDDEVSRAVLTRVAADRLTQGLSPASFDLGDAPDPLRTLAEASDRAVARRLPALIAAEGRRHGPVDQPPYATELPAEAQVRATWIVAAAMARAIEAAHDHGEAEAAIVEGAERALTQYDESERLEAQAMRLAAAIDARGELLGDMVQHAWAQGRLMLGVALIAHAGRVAFDDMLDIVTDPVATRLAMACRALGLSRAVIARLGYALAEADSRRDIERFADMLDAVTALPDDVPRAALRDMQLARGYREARAALTEAGR